MCVYQHLSTACSMPFLDLARPGCAFSCSCNTEILSSLGSWSVWASASLALLAAGGGAASAVGLK